MSLLRGENEEEEKKKSYFNPTLLYESLKNTNTTQKHFWFIFTAKHLVSSLSCDKNIDPH